MNCHDYPTEVAPGSGACLEALIARGLVSSDGKGKYFVRENRVNLRLAAKGFFDLLDTTSDFWHAYGWVVDLNTKKPCLCAIVVQDGELTEDAFYAAYERPDVNSHLGLAPGTFSGFKISFHPRSEDLDVRVFALLLSGDLVPLAGPAKSLPEAPRRAAESIRITDEEWAAKFSQPLYSFPSSSQFHGIRSVDPEFDPAQCAGVTDQFLQEAAVYHRKYTEHTRWRYLLSHAFLRSRVSPKQCLSVLDVGSGSGNTVIPLLDLLPGSSIVATDISPQLLTILRDQTRQEDQHRLLLVAMDVGHGPFAPDTFDLAVGAAILHHIIDPSETIGACFKALRGQGHAIFFEPFEAGYVVLRILYEQMIANRRSLRLPDDVVDVLQRIIRDVEVRTGSDKSGSIFQSIDDKWLFTRAYFEQQRLRFGFSQVEVYPLDPGTTQFSSQIKTHLRLCLDAGEEKLTQEARDFISSFEQKFSCELGSELLLEACVIFTK
jgi:SAM-dependent methyltransferase